MSELCHGNQRGCAIDPRELQRIVKQLPDNLGGVFLVDENDCHIPAKPENFKLCSWVLSVPGESPKFFTDEEKAGWDADRSEEASNQPLVKLDYPVLLIEE